MQKIRLDLITYSKSDEKRGFTDTGVPNQQYFEEVIAEKNKVSTFRFKIDRILGFVMRWADFAGFVGKTYYSEVVIVCFIIN